MGMQSMRKKRYKRIADDRYATDGDAKLPVDDEPKEANVAIRSNASVSMESNSWLDVASDRSLASVAFVRRRSS